MGYSLSDLMQLVAAEAALAVHLDEGQPPVVELRDALIAVEGPPVGAGESLALFRTVAREEEVKELIRSKALLLWHRFSEAVMFRVLAFQRDDSVRLELRRVTDYEEAA